MDVYLPIANLSVNGLIIVLLGGATGFLSGMFGVGGGFLTTPLLIFYGIPPTVAAASAASQVTGASVSGAVYHARRKGIDYQMGAMMIAGGIVGTGIGAFLFRLLQALGQIDVAISILYVVILAGVGIKMAIEAVPELLADRFERLKRAPSKRRHHPLFTSLPGRYRFYRSGLYISPLAPMLVGMAVGTLTMLMGIGGGFLLVPLMLYGLGMSAAVVVGTSLFQILFTTIATTMMHALTTNAVDIVLAALLLLGSVSGAQIGAKFASAAKPELLRVVLAVIVLLVALFMAAGLTYRPREIFTVAPL
ncbi:sulfite exporter TauE/SafE family protein [Croceicoccus mobilis]|uniref:Probable membrane transporter protein n=1 Tax=Croceicoccus mobilis TaxID=1703339 RepID=A0A916YR78_9SPHN|nr:sulfite exporter TauE/SafE family protein [Croceicoccus mobilis]GGD56744.1 UPF0721 transmembrane protein [Croceicoccus mobilis]